jgi:hypothetical protein
LTLDSLLQGMLRCGAKADRRNVTYRAC